MLLSRSFSFSFFSFLSFCHFFFVFVFFFNIIFFVTFDVFNDFFLLFSIFRYNILSESESFIPSCSKVSSSPKISSLQIVGISLFNHGFSNGTNFSFSNFYSFQAFSLSFSERTENGIKVFLALVS